MFGKQLIEMQDIFQNRSLCAKIWEEAFSHSASYLTKMFLVNPITLDKILIDHFKIPNGETNDLKQNFIIALGKEKAERLTALLTF